MKKIKYDFPAFLLVVCFLMVVAGCNDFSKLTEMEAGKGYLSLVIGDENSARTIMPKLDASYFEKYVLTFTKQGGSSMIPITLDHNHLSDPIALDAGTYDLEVEAYLYDTDLIPAAADTITVEISGGVTVTKSVSFAVNVDINDGEGSFSWNIEYPAAISKIEMNIVPLDGSPATTKSYNGVSPWEDSVEDLPAGYYRVLLKLYNSSGRVVSERREILHVYVDMDSHFEEAISDDTVNNVIVRITSNAGDTSPGSLREAIDSPAIAPAGSIIVIDPGVGTIALEGRLDVDRNLTIEGNGVTITRVSTSIWAEGSGSQLLYVGGVITTATINRVCFKDGVGTTRVAAILNEGNLTLESCIFSGNWALSQSGAIWSSGPLKVLGCTFYDNHASEGNGGAIFADNNVTLAGNLFYGNTAASYPVVYPRTTAVTIDSKGYNVVDIAIGTTSSQSGWASGVIGDTTVSSFTISPLNFKLLPGSGAAGVITTLPEGYPTTDFYGNAIIAPAAAGAVQSTVSGNEYALGLSYNSARGDISVSRTPDGDGLFAGGLITLTAAAETGYRLGYWMVNGQRKTENPLNLNIDSHTMVQAVFGKEVRITSNAGDSSTGSLRAAISSATITPSDSIIIIDPTVGTIVLEGRISVTRNLIIEGNGVTLERISTSSWAAAANTQILNVSSAGTATFNSVHFKNGRATTSGAAINNNGGSLTLESCIFSGNETSNSGVTGGAIYSNNGTIKFLGCTFYNNHAAPVNGGGNGGVIYTSGSCALTLAGNLFYGNTAANGPVVYRAGGTVTSLGYNVCDVAIGAGASNSGWASGKPGDTTFDALFITGSPFANAAGGDFTPVAGLQNHITSAPTEFPTTDFNGAARTTGVPGAVNYHP